MRKYLYLTVSLGLCFFCSCTKDNPDVIGDITTKTGDAGISDDSRATSDGGGTVTKDSGPPIIVACAAPRQISTKTELLNFIAQLSWSDNAPVGWGLRQWSDDVQINGTISVFVDELTLPVRTKTPAVDANVRHFWSLSAAVAGIKCLPAAGSSEQRCQTVEFKNSRFRLGLYYAYAHPDSDMVIVDIGEPCPATCPANELFCAANKQCGWQWEQYCGACLGKESATCKCTTAQGPLADGSLCMFSGGDVYENGECIDGKCVKKSRACCAAMIASCLACSAGVSVEEYCKLHPETQGC